MCGAVPKCPLLVVKKAILRESGMAWHHKKDAFGSCSIACVIFHYSVFVRKCRSLVSHDGIGRSVPCCYPSRSSTTSVPRLFGKLAAIRPYHTSPQSFSFRRFMKLSLTKCPSCTSRHMNCSRIRVSGNIIWICFWCPREIDPLLKRLDNSVCHPSKSNSSKIFRFIVESASFSRVFFRTLQYS